MKRLLVLVALSVVLLASLSLHFFDPSRGVLIAGELDGVGGRTHAELETKLKPLGKTFEMTDWQRSYKEKGQTFNEYLAAMPVRRSKTLNTIHLCLIGDFTPEQEKVIEATREYMAIFFDSPVKIRKRVSLKSIPDDAKRTHPSWGDKQMLTSYVLEQVLEPDQPEDALAYLAFTSSDLWPGQGWNFVFGQANLYKRVGVWSIYRNGDPRKDFKLCLRRTIGTAAHETGHILTIQHCIAYDCCMNGSNHREESDKKPLQFCPVCARKLAWNLQVDPVEHFKKLEAFCKKHELTEEAEYYAKAVEALR